MQRGVIRIIQVTVKYFAYLRGLVRDKREETVNLEDGARLIDLLNILIKKYGKKFQENIIKKNEKEVSLSDNIIVLISGKSVNDLNTLLKDGDIIALMPFLGGGS